MDLPSPPDIEAAIDVLRDVLDGVEDLDAERASALRVAVGRLLDQAKATVAGLETQIRSQMDGREAFAASGHSFRLEQGGRWRSDHAKIRRLVVAAACKPDEDGVAPTAGDAARVATQLMSEIYVTPSKDPPASGLALLGVNKKDVAVWKDDESSKLIIEPLRKGPAE